MKAVAYHRYGSPAVMELVDVPQPELDNDGLLIRVVAASVNRSDWETLVGRPLYARMGGLRRPREQVLGSDIAGVVEQVGDEVTDFKPGDEVLGDVLYHGKGAFAEYVSVPASAPIVPKPKEISFERAATLPQAAVLALQGLRHREGLRAGQHLLINGAGGGGGTFAIQIAKAIGAEVTAVDSAEKADAMRQAGADYAVDYRTEDYTRAGIGYDRILDFVGSRSLFANHRALADGGAYLVVGGPMRRLLMAPVAGWLVFRTSGKRMGLLTARPNKEDLREVADRVAARQLSPMIDREYPLDQVPDAMRRLGEERSLGKIVIRI